MSSSKEWQNWCRLCARVNGNELKLDTMQSVSAILQKYFRTSLIMNNDAVVCQECLDLLQNVEQFSIRSVKVNNMFMELCDNVFIDNIYSLRQKYGLSEGEEHENCAKLEAREDLQCTSTNLDALKVDEVQLVKIQMNKDLLNAKTEQLDVNYAISFAEEDNNEDYDDSYTPNRKNLRTEHKKRKRVSKLKSTNSIAEKSKVSTEIKANTSKHIKDKDVWCHLCDKTFDQPRRYRQHMRGKHIPDIMPFACDQCPKFFASEKKKLQHAASHRPVEQKKIHPCPKCDRTFSRAENVHLHIRRVHMGVRSFVCEECGKALASKGALSRHQVTHSDARPLKCNECSKRFKDLPGLKKHSETHSTISFECLLCGHRSTTRYTLREHMLVHSDEKRYECQYCGNTFKRLKTLKIHLIQHTGKRSYICPFCDLTFAYDQYLRAHKKKSHPVELACVEAAVPN